MTKTRLSEVEDQIAKLTKAKRKYGKFDFKKQGLKMTAVEFFKRKSEIEKKLASLKILRRQILKPAIIVEFFKVAPITYSGGTPVKRGSK